MPPLTFIDDGAQLFEAALSPDELVRVEAVIADAPSDTAGVRLYGRPDLAAELRAGGAVHLVATAALGPTCFPVRAMLFNKTAAANWSLGWHQDRTIVVRRRIDVPGFGRWTVKQGQHHVAPPLAILARMATVRLHLDAVTAGNAPLRIACGTHRLGIIRESEVPAIVEHSSIATCLAQRGDAWLYPTLILHASAAQSEGAQRRVLQVDYAIDDLPGGLEWLGLG